MPRSARSLRKANRSQAKLQIIDEAQLATVLSSTVGEPVDPLALSVEQSTSDPVTGMLSFTELDRRWTLASDGTLTKAAKGLRDG